MLNGAGIGSKDIAHQMRPNMSATTRIVISNETILFSDVGRLGKLVIDTIRRKIASILSEGIGN